jgi:hypothetical protein
MVLIVFLVLISLIVISFLQIGSHQIYKHYEKNEIDTIKINVMKITGVLLSILLLLFVLSRFQIFVNGRYSYCIVLLSFSISLVVLYILHENKWYKFLLSILVIPVFWYSLILAEQVVPVYTTTFKNNIQVETQYDEIFAECPSISVFKKLNFLCKKKVGFEAPFLQEISEITMDALSGDTLTISITHNGKYDSENPYKDRIVLNW